LVGTSKYWYSTVPRAGTVKSSPIVRTASGVPISQPSAKVGAGGSARRSPSFAPPSSHARMVRRSESERRRSLRKVPCGASACHGGMAPVATASRMSPARAFTVS
jgi:hypothetical protein